MVDQPEAFNSSSSSSFMTNGYPAPQSPSPLVDMYEQDAEILERGVEPSSSNPLTPLTHPQESESSSSPPSMNLGERIVGNENGCIECSSCAVENGQSHGVFDSIESATSSSAMNAAMNGDCDEGSQNPNSNERSIRQDIGSISLFHDDKDHTEAIKSGQPNSYMDQSSSTNSSPTYNMRDSLERKLSGTDRRLREAAQFAEAVGETPPRNEDEIMQVIIEDASSSDEDDDDEDDGDDSENIHQQHSKQQSMQRSKSALQITIQEDSATHQISRRRSYSHTAFDNYIPLKDKDGINHGEVASTPQFKYRGIKHNPPEVTKRGLSRGNHAQLHRKAWLEVSDKHHRYGKNLRLYYSHWESLGHPANMFFDWLDSKGEAAGWDLPDLSECPRDKLDADTVLYITDLDEQEKYKMHIKTPKRKKDMKPGERGAAGQIIDSKGDVVRTGPNGWIFVLRDHELYGAKKVISCGEGKSKQRFHHSSFFGGKAVASAGILITDDAGYLKLMFPHSGHYRPGEAHMQRLLYHVHESGVDLTSFDVDMQQIMHVSREKRDETTPKGGGGDSGEKMKKSKKMDSLHLVNAFYVALFLGQKAHLIGNGLLSQLHSIRGIEVEKRTVSNILDTIDDGGFWRKSLR